jgi:peptidoglycan L-alanyl-D-glutamate endopeptidase CwlK
MTLTDTIKAVQRKLGLDDDGSPGPLTWGAIYERVVGKKLPAAPDGGTAPVVAGDKVDPRSEGVIARLQPQVWPYARALVTRAAARGINIKIISGLRSYEEQNALYAQGRSKPGRVVTNARGGYSNHNFGIAFDIGVFDGSRYVPESPRYKAVGAIGSDLGLEWGGNWKTFKDEPHFQLRPRWATDLSESEMLAQLRGRTTSGQGYYA